MKFFQRNPLAPAEGIFYCSVFLLLSTLATAQPRLTITETKKNFGEVSKGYVVRSTYSFTNTGTEPLILDEPEIPCSCTTVEYPQQPVLPAQSGTIVIVFDTKSAYGRQDRTLQMSSNDPKGPVKLRWKGTVLVK